MFYVIFQLRRSHDFNGTILSSETYIDKTDSDLINRKILSIKNDLKKREKKNKNQNSFDKHRSSTELKGNK